MRVSKYRGMPFGDVDFDEINFHVKKNEFVYGNLIVDGNKAFIVNGIVECSEDNLQLEQWIRVRPETVGQYVVLNDEMGKEIYEGDVVKLTTEDGVFLYEVIFETKIHSRDGYDRYISSFKFKQIEDISEENIDNDEDCFEVISNIHDIKKGE